jgi:hypothetical protein
MSRSERETERSAVAPLFATCRHRPCASFAMALSGDWVAPRNYGPAEIKCQEMIRVVLADAVYVAVASTRQRARQGVRLRHRHHAPRCRSATRRSARHRHSSRSRRSSSLFTFSSASMSFIARSSASTAARRVNREGCNLCSDFVEHRTSATKSSAMRRFVQAVDLSVQGDECDHRRR